MQQINLFDYQKERFKINKPIRLIELFGGIGSQAMGLRNIGVDFEHYKLVEFDKYAVKSYNTIHGTNFETTDITDIHADDLEITDTEKYDYILTYSYPCLTGDTLVMTDNGYKCIKDIVVGDKVLTHKNRFMKVIESKMTGTKECFVINAMGTCNLKATENHKFYVREKYRYGHLSKRAFKEPQWKELKYLNKNDYLGMPINQNSIIPSWNGIVFKWKDGRKDRHKNQLGNLMNNESFWHIIGQYIGDGWQRKDYGIVICGNENKVNILTKHLNICGFNYNIIKERTVFKVHIPLSELGLFVSQFGKGALNKHLTNIVFDLPINLLKSFIDGYLVADGCFTNNVYTISTISKQLAFGIAQCISKVYKQPSKIYFNKRPEKHIIEGRVVKQNNSYQVVWKQDKRKQDKAFYEDGYIWFPINKIEKSGIEDVFDIEVENDHSFVANNVIVHNCQDLSIAGKQEGMAKGSGTRSGLLWEVERLLNECKELPQVLLMENVTEVHKKDNIKHFIKWIEFLESKGYSNYWKDLNAKDYGIPQSRNRCFMVSIRGGYYYEFPQKKKLELRFKDMIEDKVDDKYFISDALLKCFTSMKDRNGFIRGKRFKPHDLETSKYAYTITTMSGSRATDNYIKIPFNTPNGIEYKIRKITPREAWRFMGFSDEDFEKARKINSDTRLYMQAGNSIVVNVLEEIFKQML